MRDWEVTLTFTTPHILKQENARELWNAGNRFATLPGTRCYEWTSTQGADTAITAAVGATSRLVALLAEAGIFSHHVYALTAERLHPLRDDLRASQPLPEATGTDTPAR